MPDVCDLILEQHHRFRVRFAELDELRDAGGPRLAGVWRPLARLLELHAAAEEELFYPRLLEYGGEPVEETEDAITDHNSITEAVDRAAGEAPGSAAWWDAVDRAREANSSHTAEEERGALADFRRNAPVDVREDLGVRWLTWFGDHDEPDRDAKDVVAYVDAHGDDEQVDRARDLVEDD